MVSKEQLYLWCYGLRFLLICQTTLSFLTNTIAWLSKVRILFSSFKMNFSYYGFRMIQFCRRVNQIHSFLEYKIKQPKAVKSARIKMVPYIALGKPHSKLFANKKSTSDNWTFWIKMFCTHYTYFSQWKFSNANNIIMDLFILFTSVNK